MNNKELFYVESGNIDLKKQIISYLFGFLTALIFGFLYNILITIIPIVYFQVFITLVVSASLGIICRILIRFSDNRNKKSQMKHAVFVGFFANFFQLSAYVITTYNNALPSFEVYISQLFYFISPINLFSALYEINQVGTWYIASVPFNGVLLTIIWIIEFLLIMAGPILAIYISKGYPYSELQKTWYKRYVLFKDFETIAASDSFVFEFAKNPKFNIDNLQKGTGNRHTKIHVYFLKNEEYQYLTFEKVYVSKNGRGEEKKVYIINNMKISNADAEYILNKYENKVEKISII